MGLIAGPASLGLAVVTVGSLVLAIACYYGLVRPNRIAALVAAASEAEAA